MPLAFVSYFGSCFPFFYFNISMHFVGRRMNIWQKHRKLLTNINNLISSIKSLEYVMNVGQFGYLSLHKFSHFFIFMAQINIYGKIEYRPILMPILTNNISFCSYYQFLIL